MKRKVFDLILCLFFMSVIIIPTYLSVKAEQERILQREKETFRYLAPEIKEKEFLDSLMKNNIEFQNICQEIDKSN